MQVTLDILDDRLDAIEAADDRERLRAYLAMWRDGTIDPLHDEGVMLVVDFGDGSCPVVANDGSGDAGDRPPGGRQHGRGRGPTRH